MWSLRSSLYPDRFVTYTDADGWSADEDTVRAMESQGGPFADALLTPVGPVYVSSGEGDMVALYLHAASALPGALLVVEGSELPSLPDVPDVPDGAVS